MKYLEIKSKLNFFRINFIEIFLILICFISFIIIFATLRIFKTYVSKNNSYVIISGNEFPSSQKNQYAEYPFFSNNDVSLIKNNIDTVDKIEFYKEKYDQILYQNNNIYRISSVAEAYPSIKNFLQLNIFVGNFYRENEKNSIVMSEKMAILIFKKTNIIGEKIILSEFGSAVKDQYVVSGVFKDMNKNENIKNFQAFLYPKEKNISESKTSTLLVKSKEGKFTLSQGQIVDYIKSYYKNDTYFKTKVGSVYVSLTGDSGFFAKPKIQLTFDEIIFSSLSTILLTICLVCIFTTFFFEISTRDKKNRHIACIWMQ